MHATELQLPKHLYTETRDADGNITDITYAAEKLVAWSSYGHGNAVNSWYQDICDRKIEAIDTWEDNQFLLQEEKWLEQENGQDDEAAEANYDLACQAISREADRKRQAVMTHIEECKNAIEKLVSQSKEHIEAHQPAEQVDNSFMILLAIGGAIALIYMLLT